MNTLSCVLWLTMFMQVKIIDFGAAVDMQVRVLQGSRDLGTSETQMPRTH